MNPERYRRVDEVFQQALSRPAESRNSFLREVCAGDEDLRREVESLIEHERRAALWPDSRSRESGAGPASARPGLAGPPQPELEGRSLLHYRIEEKIGQGGMGVVYRAEDTHLRRLVAIKVLPPDKMLDPERKKRFIHEARAASALNHPNIITIHDITSADGIDFIAMEYVAGRPLAELIAGKGLPIREALKYAIEIADALAKAHRAGIIHRDLKPSNILVTEDGTVKILDFGLAKLTHPEQESASGLSESLTESGVIVGTAAYMSPEQAEGKEVDERSDIFAFGAVLYEMITGRRAFNGDSNISTLAAVLHEEVEPAGKIAGAVPAELERIIARCLRKDPARRFQHLDDVKVALEELTEETARRRPSKVRYWVGASAILVIAGGMWAYLTFHPAEEEPLPPPRILQITSLPGFHMSPSLSPDGSLIAFQSDLAERGNSDIYVKDLDSTGEPTRLTTDPAYDGFPAWSPDGRRIAFTRGTLGGGYGLYVVSPLGGGESKVADAGGEWLSWSPDGNNIAFTVDTEGRKGRFPAVWSIWSIALDTLQPKQLVKPAVSSGVDDIRPSYSPDGRYLAFVRRSALARTGLYRMKLPDGDPILVTEYGNPQSFSWTSDSREIVFSTASDMGEIALWRIAADGGQPRRIPVRGERTWMPSISRNRLAYVNETGNADIWRISLTGPEAMKTPAQPLFSWPSNETNSDISPDGRKITFQSDRSGTMEIWVCNIDGSNPKQITNMKATNTGSPSWSPDGKMVVFDSQKSGNLEIWVVSADGGQARQLTDNPAEDAAARWSRNGRWIYFYSNRGGNANIWRMPSEGGKAQPVTKEGNVFLFFSESIDGRFLYYSTVPWLTDQRLKLYRVPVSGGPSRLIFETDEGVLGLVFALTERGIYFRDPGWLFGAQVRPLSIKLYDFATRQQKTVALSHNDPSFFMNFLLRISPDGQWLFYSGAVSRTEIMLMENFR